MPVSVRSSALAAALSAAYCVGDSTEVRVEAQGWYRDPYLVHEDRWFSAGQPTKLVRDSGIETYDPPPVSPPKVELVEARHSHPTDGSALRRADDLSAGAVYDAKAAFWAIMDRAPSSAAWLNDRYTWPGPSRRDP